ncbi:DUF6214 family protein [Microbacterium sp. SS28]|uniref:DUF6214 family protein n=1 Tax=Microbacterium sp. SS28 TaxID=2919948 RepID=UPI001FAA8AFF|nr:DUF6214 family protein [Microbacterium sp. SS28]
MAQFVETSGQTIVVPPGIALPARIEGSLPVDHKNVGALEPNDVVMARFRLEYSSESRRYEIASFGLDRGEAAVEIVGALWRTVRVHSIVRTAIELGLPSWTESIPRARFRRRDGVLRDAPNYRPSDPDGLLLAALAYRIAEVSGENPALAVAETLGLKQRTATNWIARARQSDYFTSTDHEAASRRIAKELWGRMPLLERPRTDEEETVYRANEVERVRSYLEHQARWRRTSDGDD